MAGQVCPQLYCKDHSGMQERLKFVEITLKDLLPELKGALKDVNTCVNQLNEQINYLLELKSTIKELDSRVRYVEDFVISFEAYKSSTEKHFKYGIAILTIIISLITGFSSWYSTHKQDEFIKQLVNKVIVSQEPSNKSLNKNFKLENLNNE